MNNKIVFSILLFFFIMPLYVNASINSLVKIGNKYYDTLEEAINNADENDTITLISNINNLNTININKTVNIDLNGNDITSKEKVFLVEGGTLNITGKGTIKETSPNYGAIMIKGSTNPKDINYSTVNISKDVNLEGWSGIFITHNDNKSYGVMVNFNGNINAKNDTSGETGIGIYLNGNIKDNHNSPIINISNDSTIESTGNGLYIAGYGVFNIAKANISGVDSGIGIKSGILNIDGATVTGTGIDKTPTTGYENGIKPSGTAIQIESNNSYAGDIEVNIDGGTFISKNSHVFYEYIGKGNISQVIALDISGGKFINSKSKENFVISDSLKEYHNNFISGGEYSNNPLQFLKPGYTVNKVDGVYKVTQSQSNQVFLEETHKINIFPPIIIIILILIVLTIFLSKRKIFTIK